MYLCVLHAMALKIRENATTKFNLNLLSSLILNVRKNEHKDILSPYCVTCMNCMQRKIKNLFKLNRRILHFRVHNCRSQ
jgi:hypothetical protein